MHNRNRAVGRLRWIAIVIMLVVMFLVRFEREAKSPAKKKRVMPSCHGVDVVMHARARAVSAAAARHV